MWAFFEKLLSILAPVLSGLLAYQKGKKDVQEQGTERTLDDVQKRQSVELEIKRSYADPDMRKRMRDDTTGE